MIKLPKEVSAILRKLKTEKYDAFAVGGCVRDSLAGEKPYDWDITTSARFDELKRLFPEAKVLSEKYSVIRFEYLEDVLDEDGEVIGEDGIVVDVSTMRKLESEGDIFTDSIEEDLKRRDFTVNAIADSGDRFVDPFDGRGDINKKLVKTLTDADESFKKDPIRMMKAIRIAAELDFDLTKNVFEAICSNYQLLKNVSIDRFRDELMGIFAAAHAGKGINLLMDSGIINIVLGDGVVNRLNHREKADLVMLCDNVDKTKQVPERRLGLFFIAINKKYAVPAIERLGFDAETEQNLIDACYDMPKLYFTNDKTGLKQFIYRHGMQRYNYLANLEKAQRIVYEYDSRLKIEGKMHFLREINTNGEPIFPEDLAIDANDLLEAGICDVDDAQQMLIMLVETTHIKPHLNNREKLLELARKYKKNKLAAKTRTVRWIR